MKDFLLKYTLSYLLVCFPWSAYALNLLHPAPSGKKTEVQTKVDLGDVRNGFIVEFQSAPVFQVLAPLVSVATAEREILDAANKQKNLLEDEQDAFLSELRRDPKIKEILELPGVQIKKYLRGINAVGFNFVRTSAGESEVGKLYEALKLYAETHAKDIKKIHPNVTVSGTLLNSTTLVQAPQNYKVFSVLNNQRSNRDGFGVRIGIVDTGINFTHPDLGGQYCGSCKVIRGYDYVNQDLDPSDDHGHGTHVASIAAGLGQISQNNSLVNILGVAPGALLVPFKVLGSNNSGTSDNIISAVEDCADPNGDLSPSDRLDVCNLSLGGPGYPDDAMSVAVDQTTGVGVLFVVSAGNDGSQGIRSPGTARRALTVGASCKPNQIGIDPSCADSVASYSSSGPVNWIAVNPTTGFDEYLTLQKPDLVAPGNQICAAQLDFWQQPSQCNDANHIAISGTSMAAPHVSGLAAILKQVNPALGPQAIKDALMNSAQSLGVNVYRQGKGLAQLSNALNLLQAPRDRMEVTTGPILLFDVPTTRIQEYSRTVTFRNGNSTAVNVSLLPGGLPQGVSVQGTNINNLGANQQGNIILKFTLDHAVLSASKLYLNQLRFNIQPTGSSAYPVSVGTYIRVGEYIRVLLGDELEFPIFSPTATAESQLKTISIQNLLTDYPLNVTASFDPSSYDDQRTFYSSRGAATPNISFQLLDGGTPISSISLAPNQSRIIDIRANLAADVKPYAYRSQVSFSSSPNGILHSRVLRVYRGYALRLQSGWPIDALSVVGNTRIDHAAGVPPGGNRGQWKSVGSGYTNPSSYTFVSQDPHSVDVYAAWLAPLSSSVHASWIIRDKNLQGQPLAFHYPAPLNTFDQSYPTNTPLFTVTFDPKDLNGVSQPDYLSYGFHGRDYRTGIMGRLPPLKRQIKVNQLPSYFRFTGSKSMIYDLVPNAGISTANQKTLVWSYKLLGISSNVTLTNTPAQLIQRKLKGPLGQNFEISIYDREVADNTGMGWFVGQYLRDESSIFFYSNETNTNDFASDPYGRTPLIGFEEFYNGFNLPSYFFTPTRMLTVKNWELRNSDTRGNRYTSLNEGAFYRRNQIDHTNVRSIVLGGTLFSNPNSVLGARGLGSGSSSLTNVSADVGAGIENLYGGSARSRFGSANRSTAVNYSTDITVNGSLVLQGCIVSPFTCLALANFTSFANQSVNIRTTSSNVVPWRTSPLVNTLTQNFTMIDDRMLNSPPKFETIKLINTQNNEESDTLSPGNVNALDFVIDPQANFMQYADFFTTRYTESQNPGPFSSDPQRRGILNSSYPIVPCSTLASSGTILSTQENIRVGCVRFRTNSDGTPDTLTSVTVQARAITSNTWQTLPVVPMYSGSAFFHYRAALPNLCGPGVSSVQLQFSATDSRFSSTTSLVTAFCP